MARICRATTILGKKVLPFTRKSILQYVDFTDANLHFQKNMFTYHDFQKDHELCYNSFESLAVHGFLQITSKLSETMFSTHNFSKKTWNFETIHQKPQTFMKKTSDFPQIDKTTKTYWNYLQLYNNDHSILHATIKAKPVVKKSIYH